MIRSKNQKISNGRGGYDALPDPSEKWSAEELPSNQKKKVILPFWPITREDAPPREGGTLV